MLLYENAYSGLVPLLPIQWEPESKVDLTKDIPWKWEERLLGRVAHKIEIAQDWGSPGSAVKPICKSALPPGDHTRALPPTWFGEKDI